MANPGLRPGEHGEIFIREVGANKHEARVRLRLFDGSTTFIARTRSTRQSARLAAQAEIEQVLNAPTGSEDLQADSKVGLAARQWITELRAQSRWPNPPVRPQTVDGYELLLGNHLIPVLGKKKLNELTTAMCQRWIDGIIERGRSGPHDLIWTADQAKFCFTAVLDRAIRHDAMRMNPVEKVKTPRPSTPVPRAMTVIEIYRLRKAVRDWEASRIGRPGPRPTGSLPAAVDLMLGTGLRIGEVLALQWGEVSLTGPRPTVAVVATLVDVKGEGTIRQTKAKTDAGERTIVLPRFAVDALEAIRPASPEPTTPVFPSRSFRDGRVSCKPQTTHNVRRTLRLALDLAKMSGEVHPHLLRKTVATYVARERGAGDAASVLGHKINAGVTGKHYIERLRVAPDVSDVLEQLVEIAEEEGAKWEAAKERRLKGQAAILPAPTILAATERATASRTVKVAAMVEEVSGW
ncbi:site-specific integrase [Georgenia sp. M64]|uniref:tyrosine-type recombinase/integrase n=1 Tax=Georgenia sp. M64 TaxID=3120520 RepID=UPI0030DEA1EE